VLPFGRGLVVPRHVLDGVADLVHGELQVLQIHSGLGRVSHDVVTSTRHMVSPHRRASVLVRWLTVAERAQMPGFAGSPRRAGAGREARVSRPVLPPTLRPIGA
jgi:hypothetical protein